MISVYIASSYTYPLGRQEENVLKSFKVFNELIDLGFLPFAPLTSHYINLHYKKSYKQWIEYDLHWLSKCDAVLRLPGKSKGADIEVNFAKNDLKIPVFFSIDELKKYYKKKGYCNTCKYRDKTNNKCNVHKYEIFDIKNSSCADYENERY